MGFKVEKLTKEHLDEVLNHPSNAEAKKVYTEEIYKVLINSEHSFAGVLEGRVLICAGLEQLWRNRSVVWTLISTKNKLDFIYVHKAAKRFLNLVATDIRIEMHVIKDFKQGHRWARLLGFELEAACMKQFAYGVDYSLYAMVRS